MTVLKETQGYIAATHSPKSSFEQDSTVTDWVVFFVKYVHFTYRNGWRAF